MSAPLSSAPRGTAPTSSPNTAPVIKFRCLYTHDLRRKSKRWQDGYLRYHAFNKRIMVYDDLGNYIGDHHWRSGEEVQDGDELELDKGALIQVCERVGTTQQDLSNLFEKRKSSQGSPQTGDRASQVPRTSTPVRSSASSQPFRSLNDLLGIKKTPIAHLVSPYEERNPPPPTNTSHSPDRAPKRQKVAHAERPSNNQKTPAQVVDLTGPQRGPLMTSARNTASTRETPRLQDSRSSPLPPPKEKPRPPNPTRPPSSDSPAFTKPPLPFPASRTSPETAARTTAKDTPRERPDDTFPARPRPVPENPSSEAPVKKLRLSTQKPRKKLMYSALLPSETQKSSPTPPAPPTKRSQSTPKAADQSVRTRGVSNECAKRSRPANPPPELESTNAEFMPSDSTQVILEEMADAPTAGSKTTGETHSPASRTLSARRSLDVPLRKSLSDPTALTAKRGLQTRPTLMRSAMSAAPEPPTEGEEGPWTCEALDLFDFWPPGRPKPS